MNPSLISAASLENVLKELHGKRKWLDTVISGLESSVNSPHQKLISMAVESFTEQGDRTPKVDLGTHRQSQLAELADLVSKPKRGRPRGRRRAAAA